MWEGRVEALFPDFFWLMFPVLGMGIAYVAIWTDHRRQMKGLELLRTYAEQGKEPPQTVVDSLPGIIGASSAKSPKTRGAHFAQAALLAVLSAGFGWLAYRIMGNLAVYVFFWGFSITSFALAGCAPPQIGLGLAAPPPEEPWRP